ncbi:MAG: hypothetical protein M1426_02780 [Patescibacteria group bacterium]|nr:hypothetical protein [Patescibacteria group bacterium]
MLIILIAVLVFLVTRGQQSVNISQNQVTSPTSAVQNGKVFDEKEDSQGAVIITAKPLKINDGENTVFEISYNTHTVGLDKDLKNISVMTDDKGKEYESISWAGGEGHHVRGNLIFPPVSKDAKSVRLAIKGIDNIDRNFEWKLIN